MGKGERGRYRDGPPPAVRFHKRKWTPFRDVTDDYYSGMVRHLRLKGVDRLIALTGHAQGRIYENAHYVVIKTPLPVRKEDGGVGTGYQLSIRTQEREAEHDWRHFQRIKNELVGPEFEAVEIYPAESRLVDTANQYYLYVFPEGCRVPFGFRERLVVAGDRQRPWPRGEQPADARDSPLTADADEILARIALYKQKEQFRERDPDPAQGAAAHPVGAGAGGQAPAGGHGPGGRPLPRRPGAEVRDPGEHQEAPEDPGVHGRPGQDLPGPPGEDRRELREPDPAQPARPSAQGEDR